MVGVAIEHITVPVGHGQSKGQRGVLGVHCHKDRVTLGRAGDKPLRPGVACSPCRHLFGRVGAKVGYADHCKCQRRERLGIAGAERAEGIVYAPARAS